MHILGGCAILLLIAVAILGLFAAGLAALKRSARDTRGSGSLGNAMQEVEGLFVESKKHTIEAQRAEKEEEDDSGEPPEK